MLYQAIDSTKQYLRTRLRRDSVPWKVIVGGVQFSLLVYYNNPLNRRRWLANRKIFEQAIDDLQKHTPEVWFLQIGACDGLMDDPLSHRIKANGWRGVLVEPQKHEFERLRENYRAQEDRLSFVNAALAADDGDRLLYKVKEDRITAEWQRGIASFLPLKGIDDPTMITTETVSCITFDTLLKQHAMKRIDLLQIDVEGFDYEILKLLDLTRIKPRLIQYEHRHLSLSDTSACKEYLEHNGYKVLQMEFDTGAVLQSAH